MTLGTFVNRFYHSNINLKEAAFEVDSLALDYLVGSYDIPMILSIRIQLITVKSPKYGEIPIQQTRYFLGRQLHLL